MKRGEIWSLRDRQYASKARPVVVIQSDAHASFDSVIRCLFTTYDSCDIATQVHVRANEANGLYADSYVMTDKIITVDKAMLGERIDALSEKDMKAVSNQLIKILGL